MPGRMESGTGLQITGELQEPKRSTGAQTPQDGILTGVWQVHRNHGSQGRPIEKMNRLDGEEKEEVARFAQPGGKTLTCSREFWR